MCAVIQPNSSLSETFLLSLTSVIHTLSVADLMFSIRQIDLLDPAAIQELQATPEYQSEDTAGVVRVALQKGWVTPFQASRLVDGQTASLHVGGYLLRDLLGESPMGTWYRATFGRNPQPEFHLLRFSVNWLGNRDSTPTFLARLLACVPIRNRFLIPVVDAGANGVEPYLVNEIIDGADIATLIREMGPMPVSLACEYIRQAALGLQALHQAGLAHGNINPNTILLTPVKRSATAEGIKVRLVLGATVRIAEVGITPNRAPATELIGTPLLTAPAFLPPERITDGGLQPSGDIYQLGATLTYLLTGQPPASGANDAEILTTIVQSEPLPLQNVPQEVNSLIQLMMYREAALRPSAEVVAARLFPFCEPSVMPGAIPTNQNDLPMVEALPEDHFLHQAPDNESVLPTPSARSGVDIFEESRNDPNAPANATVSRPRRISRKTMILLLLFGLFLNTVAVGGWILYSQIMDNTEEPKKEEEPKNQPPQKKGGGKGKKSTV